MKSPQLLKIFPLIISVCLLSSCASTQTGTDKCRNVAWNHLGHQDAIHGKDKQILNKTFAHCGPNVRINKKAYNKGWKQGITVYCSSRNGLRLGMRGKLYNNICPDNQISAFDKAWKQGLRDYCTPSNGYVRGLEGKSFPGYCAPDLNVAFKISYNHGRRIYQRLAKLKTKYEKINTQVQTIKSDIQSKEKLLRGLEEAFAHQPFSPQRQYKIQTIKIRVKRLATKMDQLIEQGNAILQKYAGIKKQYTSTML